MARGYVGGRQITRDWPGCPECSVTRRPNSLAVLPSGEQGTQLVRNKRPGAEDLLSADHSRTAEAKFRPNINHACGLTQPGYSSVIWLNTSSSLPADRLRRPESLRHRLVASMAAGVSGAPASCARRWPRAG